jgi:ribosomal protein S18 acetylase RimI-like enzyme
MNGSAQSPRGTVTIRRATEADATLLSRLARRLFEETFGPMNDPADMRAYVSNAFSVEAERAALRDADCGVWIVEDATSSALGYAMMRRGSTAGSVVSKRPAELERIYVDRGLHGLGVGDALMRTCVEHARGWHCDVLWLGVWEHNPRAIAFYQKAGFRVVGQQSFHLGSDLQQDFVMARPLD